MTVLNGLDALDADRDAKVASRRAARPIPAPKRYTPATDATPAVEEPITPETAAQEPVAVDVREEPQKAPAPPQRPVKAAKRQEGSRGTQQAPEVDEGPLRAAQLYLDGTTDGHLRRIKAAALIEGSDVTNSAVVRRAITELVERHGYDGIVRLIDNDPRSARGKGRPRR